MSRHVLRRAGLLAVALVAGSAGVGGSPRPLHAAGPTGIVVDVNDDTNVADGHCSLREAIISANTNSQAQAGVGECAGGDDATEDVITFALADPFIVLTGPLPTIASGSQVRIKGDPDLSANGPIISGNDATNVLTVDNGQLTLDKVTIAHSAGTQGTAVNVLSGTLDIAGGNISANAGSGPGAILAGGPLATITIEGATFVHNTVAAADGSVIGISGTLQASHLILLENYRAPGGNAGGIAINGGTLELADSSLTDTQGRGIRVSHGTADIQRVRIIRSTLAAACAGIQSEDSSLTLADSELFGNESTANGGGGLCVTGADGIGQVVVKRTSITNNHAATTGAGAVITGPSVTFANVTLSQNVAGTDGGALVVGGEAAHAAGLSLLNVTIAENVNNGSAGHAVVFANSSTTAVIQNSIVAGNYPLNLSDMPSGGTLTVGSSLVDVEMSGLIGSLDQNGGVGMTNLLLATGTAALNTGGSGVCAASPVDGVDQRGLPRPAGACDIGALERDAVAPTATAPVLRVRKGSTLNGSTVIGHFSWVGSDGAGAGIRLFHVLRSMDGGAFTEIAITPDPSILVQLAPGHRFAFRVRAEDRDGNLSAPATTPVYPVALVQQTTAAFTYGAGWKVAASTSFSGGSARYATAAGATTVFKATARQYAFITTTGPTRGKARIYVDGGLVATVDLWSPTTVTRVQAWTARYTTSQLRTIKVVVAGTAGRPRVDVDGFAILK